MTNATRKWIFLKVSSLLMVPFMIWFLIKFVSIYDGNYQNIVEFFSNQTSTVIFSIFPVLMMGIFSKRMNKQGAIAGMTAGLGVTLLYVFQHKGIMFIPGTSFLGTMDENWFFGITPNAFGAIGAIVNFIVALIVSANTETPPAEARELVERIRVPGD